MLLLTMNTRKNPIVCFKIQTNRQEKTPSTHGANSEVQFRQCNIYFVGSYTSLLCLQIYVQL